MINAKQLTESAIMSLIHQSMNRLKEVCPSLTEDQEVKIKEKFSQLMEEYLDTNFWYQEASILLVKLIDYIEENLGISLESTIYDGKAEKWLQHFNRITYNYTESP